MSDEIARTISNDMHRYRLLNLTKLPQPAGYVPPPTGRGPFAILQEGSAPGDLTSRKLDFVLTKEGRWLPLYAFMQMPVAERRALCVFATAGEVMEHLQTVTGPAELDGQRIASAMGLTLPESPDEFGQAILDAKSSAEGIGG